MHFGYLVRMHDLMTTQEVAARYGRSPATITRWVRNGVLKATAQAPGTNGAFLFDRAYIESLRDNVA